MTGAPVIDYQSLFVAIPTPLMVLDRELCFVVANDRYLAITGRRWDDLVGRFLFDAFPEEPARRATVENSLRIALTGETTTLDRIVFAIQQPDGSRRDIYWTARHLPIRAADGSIVGVMQNTMDVTAEVATERMREVISQEYDHRVRNILTKVSAIARRTASSTATMQQFLADFDPRIASMARAHQLLVHGGWERLGLAELVASELQPYAPKAGVQIVVEGPNLPLSSRVAQALGMALHELATNAVKYGALARPVGRLAVRWTADASAGPDTGLILNWTETGLDGIAAPSRSGFGSTIIDRILPAETGGSVTRRFEPGGMACTIAIPAPMAAEPAQTVIDIPR